MAEQLPLSYQAVPDEAARQSEVEAQPLLFEFRPDIDIHLADADFAHATFNGVEHERAAWWLNKIVTSTAPVRSRRVAFPAKDLDRLLCVMPPAKVTLDAASLAVARALWANALGMRPLRVTRDGQRLLAHSVRWPPGWRLVDVPWYAISALERAGVPLDVEPRATSLLLRRLTDAGRPVARAGLAGSAVRIDTNRPELVEALELPGLAYAGPVGTGRYRLPVLTADPLLREPLIEVPPDVERAIKKATSRTRAVTAPAGFPWELYAFQARDLGRGLRILEHTGGVLFAGEQGSGKALAVDELVATPAGPVPIGKLSVGDEVFGTDGLPHHVTGVFPQGVRPLFRVTFTDGQTVIADGDHLWPTNTGLRRQRHRPWRKHTTIQIANTLRNSSGYVNHYSPISGILRYDPADVPLDPYVLGCLLGDGNLPEVGMVSFSNVDPHVTAEFARLLPPTDELSPVGNDKDYRVRRRVRSNAASTTRQAVLALGLRGHRAWEKFIPDLYKYASVEQRIQLLQGLLDTDGTVDRAPSSSYSLTTTSERLASDVVELVGSLGGVARKRGPIVKKYPYGGELRTGRDAWQVGINLPAGMAPFRTPTKSSRLLPRVKYPPCRAICDVQPVEAGEAVCISVDAEDRNFVLANGVVTSNTTIALAAAAHLDCWPVLVVAPLAAFSTWDRQLTEMGRSNLLAIGPPDEIRERIAAGDWDALVVSYDRLHLFLPDLEAAGLGAIIADEIQRIRTPTSRRSRALRALAGSVPLRIGLSGTPVTNKAEDVLPLGAFLVPGEWPPRLRAADLSEIYPGEEPTEALAEHLGTMMVRRRMDDTGVKLPGRNVSRVQVPLTPEQRRALHDLEEEARAAKEAGELGGHLHVFARLQKMRQIVNVPAVAGVGGPNPKVAAAVDLAIEFSEMGRKSVVFVADRPAWTEVGDALTKAGVGWTGIWGSTPIGDRMGNEKKFHTDDSIRVFVGTLAACAEALTLSPTATVTIFAALSYSPSAIAQAAARTYRMNQTNDVDEIYLHASAAGGTLDDRMHEILELKRQLIARVVDRTDHVDGAAKLSYADLVFMLTGERDAVADMVLADAEAADAEVERRKAHARATLYKRKTGESLDDGGAAATREEWEAAELERLEADIDDEDDWESVLSES